MIKLLCSISIVCLTFAADFPSHLPRCAVSDTDCIQKVIPKYLTSGKRGLPEINLVPLDPLHIDKLDIIQGSKSPVNIQLKFKNLTVSGLSEARIKAISGFDKDPLTSKFEVFGEVKNILIKGPYRINGSVLILPIRGVGESSIRLENVDFKIQFSLKAKKNSEYVETTKVKFTFNPHLVVMYFGNLFNNDKLLGESTNRFLNQNWEGIFDEIKPAIGNAFQVIVKNVIDQFFAKVPYNKIYA